jgi:hypothetical protein
MESIAIDPTTSDEAFLVVMSVLAFSNKALKPFPNAERFVVLEFIV